MAMVEQHIAEIIPYGGWSIMVWGCVSHDCKLDLVTTVQENLTHCDINVRSYKQVLYQILTITTVQFS